MCVCKYLQNGKIKIFGFPTKLWQLYVLNLVKISSTSIRPPSTNSTSFCSPWLRTANIKQSYNRMSLHCTMFFRRSKNSCTNKSNRIGIILLINIYGNYNHLNGMIRNGIESNLPTNFVKSSCTQTKNPI